VQTQRAAFEEPLDDVMVVGEFEDSRRSKLHLQIKSAIAFTEADDNWADVLRQAWDTVSAEGFDPVTERVGVGISVYNAKVDWHYQSVLNWAVHSSNSDDFFQRIKKKDFSHADREAFVQTIQNVLTRHIGRGTANDELWNLLRTFVIIHFDFQSEQSSRDVASVIDRLRWFLPLDQRNHAGRVWDYLVQRAGQLIPAGGSANRSTLVDQLTTEGLPTGTAPSFRQDIQAIHCESERALCDIRSDINGLKLYRSEAYRQTRQALTESRFIQIDGEPGVGKSALLKEIAEECAQIGPVFVLKEGRIHPRGWNAHAHTLGVIDDLPALLQEFGCCSEPILFIDGIDKISDPAIQLTVNDLVRAIAQNERLVGWRILVSVREQNLRHLETWLDPDAFRKLPIKTVTVETLGDEELSVVVERFPRLEPLLLQVGGMDVIVKRPFFLSALLTLAGRDGTTQLPATEVELLKLWWELGASDRQDTSRAQHRRNALMQLAEQLVRSPNSPIPIIAVSPEPLEELKLSGVVRDKTLGHSVVFTHDIYEEWALCELLIQHQAEISGFLKASGELQALVRPMQLLGAYSLETDSSTDEWKHLFEETGNPVLRPVWQRAILTSCVQSTRTTLLLEKLSDYLLEREHERLKRLLLAMRTIEVTPNPLYLDEKLLPDLEPSVRAKLAHHAAVPKALTWVRFLDWLVPHVETLPPSLITDLIPLFATWQNTFAGRNVRHCRKIGEMCHRWLIEFEDAIHPLSYAQRRYPLGLSVRYEDERNIEQSLRSTLLSSAGDVPKLVADYIHAKVADRARRHIFRDEILKNCSALIRHLPTELVDFILNAFLEHPGDHRDEWGSYNDHMVRELGVASHSQFYPASPVQLPFLGLLRQHEEQGLRLVHALCNHSVSIWRWARANDWHHQPQTPLPLRLTFPWGRRNFWGGGQIYLWFRGYWGNHAVQSALMALEQWALEQIEQGSKFEEVFQKVIQGNKSVAALGIGVSLCLAYPNKSIECSLPLVTCPHLWHWDIARLVQDSHGTPSNEIGNWSQHRLQLSAVRTLNQKEHRRRDIRSLVPYFVHWHDRALTRRYTQAIRSFPKRLPFEYSEERTNQAYVSSLHERMVLYSEQGDPKYWKQAPKDDGKGIQIWNDPPSLKAEKYQAQQSKYSHFNECMALALWAQKSLDDGKLDERFSVEQGVAKAKQLDSADLFNKYHQPEDFSEDQRAAGIAGVAYVVARFGNEGLWNDMVGTWCLDVLQRAANVADAPHTLLVRSARLTMHPKIFAAHGYSALLLRGRETKRSKTAILKLALDALEDVVNTVFSSANLYASRESDFYWILFDLGIRQCIVPRNEIPNYHSTQWDQREGARNMELIMHAEHFVESGSEPMLPDIPMPWVKIGSLSIQPSESIKGFVPNDTVFLFNLAEKTVFHTSLDNILQDPNKRRSFLMVLTQLLDFTIQEIAPPFAQSKRDHDGNVPYEWVYGFSSWCGKVCAHLSETEAKNEVLARISSSDNDTALQLMESLLPSFMIEALLTPAQIIDSNLALWREMTDWVFDNPAWKHGKGDRHLDREFQSCAFNTLFCVAHSFSPLICGVDPGWPNLERFRPIIERAAREFGLHKTLNLGLTAFLKRGGFDFLPDPALAWLRDIAMAKKQDQAFWQVNGDDTVEIMKMMTEKKGGLLQPSHREMMVLIIDILVDNGVRGAGFFQQELLRG